MRAVREQAVFEGLVDPGRRGYDGRVTSAGAHYSVAPLMLETRVEEGVSSCSAAVVEHLGGVDNLAYYGRSLGLIEGLVKVHVADRHAHELQASHEVCVARG